MVINAIGPETFTYRELVAEIGRIGKQRPIVSVPPWLGYAMTRALGMVLGDVAGDPRRDRGAHGRPVVRRSPPAGQTGLTAWLRQHADTVGRRYASELARRKDRTSAYSKG